MTWWHVALIFTAWWTLVWVVQGKLIYGSSLLADRVERVAFAGWLIVAVAVSTGFVVAAEAWR